MTYLIITFFLTILNLQISQISLFPIPTPSDKIPPQCKNSCDVSYGQIIGGHKNVFAYSNCNNNCTNFIDGGVTFYKNETNFVKDVFVGVRWQCVEFARRWMIINKKSSFGEIEGAHQIFNLTIVEDLTKINITKPFHSINNGHIKPPMKGDLIIYPISSDAPYGHVAVVGGINLLLGYLDILEQNYSNYWVNPNYYARRVVILKCNRIEYTLTEITWTLQFFDNLTPAEVDEICIREKNKVLGFKRVIEKNVRSIRDFE